MTAVHPATWEVPIKAFPDSYQPTLVRLRNEGWIVGTEYQGNDHIAVLLRNGNSTTVAKTTGDRKSHYQFRRHLREQGVPEYLTTAHGTNDKPRKGGKRAGRPANPAAPGWPTTLRERRLEGGLTHDGLVDGLKNLGVQVNREQISKWESGNGEPTTLQREGLMALFGDDLFSQETEPETPEEAPVELFKAEDVAIRIPVTPETERIAKLVPTAVVPRPAETLSDVYPEAAPKPPTETRITVGFEPDAYEALKARANAEHRTLSQVVRLATERALAPQDDAATAPTELDGYAFDFRKLAQKVYDAGHEDGAQAGSAAQAAKIRELQEKVASLNAEIEEMKKAAKHFMAAFGGN